MKKYQITIIFILILSTLQIGCKKQPVISKYNPSEWVMDDTGKYPYTMTAVVTLPRTLNNSIQSEDHLGAFINGKCRGIGELHQVNGNAVYFVLIQGEAAEQEPVIFRYFRSASSTLYYSYNALVFSIDGNFGVADEPEVLKFKQP